MSLLMPRTFFLCTLVSIAAGCSSPGAYVNLVRTDMGEDHPEVSWKEYHEGDVMTVFLAGFEIGCNLHVKIETRDGFITHNLVVASNEDHITQTVSHSHFDSGSRPWFVRVYNDAEELLGETFFVFGSHFRFAHVNWERDSSDPLLIHFEMTTGWRFSSGPYPTVVGAKAYPEYIYFGDGTYLAPEHTLIAVDDKPNPDAGYWIGTAKFEHRYQSHGMYTAEISSCCRIFGLQYGSSNYFRVVAKVDTSVSSSPRALLPPKVRVSRGASSFQIPWTGSGQVTFRIATESESSIRSPIGASVSSTGLYTFDFTRGDSTNLGNLFGTQVILQTGSVEVGLDFILEVVADPTHPPPKSVFLTISASVTVDVCGMTNNEFTRIVEQSYRNFGSSPFTIRSLTSAQQNCNRRLRRLQQTGSTTFNFVVNTDVFGRVDAFFQQLTSVNGVRAVSTVHSSELVNHIEYDATDEFTQFLQFESDAPAGVTLQAILPLNSKSSTLLPSSGPLVSTTITVRVDCESKDPTRRLIVLDVRVDGISYLFSAAVLVTSLTDTDGDGVSDGCDACPHFGVNNGKAVCMSTTPVHQSCQEVQADGRIDGPGSVVLSGISTSFTLRMLFTSCAYHNVPVFVVVAADGSALTPDVVPSPPDFCTCYAQVKTYHYTLSGGAVAVSVRFSGAYVTFMETTLDGGAPYCEFGNCAYTYLCQSYHWMDSKSLGLHNEVTTFSTSLPLAVSNVAGFQKQLCIIFDGETGDCFAMGAAKSYAINHKCPLADIKGPKTGLEYSKVLLSGEGSADPEPTGSIVEYSWDLQSAGFSQQCKTPMCNVDLPSSQGSPFTVQLEVIDDEGASATASSTMIIVSNVPPSIDVQSAQYTIAPIPINSLTNLVFAFTDPDSADNHVASCSWAQMGTPVSVTVANRMVTVVLSFPKPDLYTISCTVSDEWASSTATFTTPFVAYDNTAGHVTGGGRFNSWPGAYLPDPTLAGPANFAFSCRYLPGKNVPTGNNKLWIKNSALDFDSTTFEYLLVQGQSRKAKMKGTGFMKNQPSRPLQFVVTIYDDAGPGDLYHIKIFDAQTVYDNEPAHSDDDWSLSTTVLAGSGIQIHAKN